MRQATRHLAKDSSAQVRTEIQEHYEEARNAALIGDATADESDRVLRVPLLMRKPRSANIAAFC